MNDKFKLIKIMGFLIGALIFTTIFIGPIFTVTLH